MNVGLNYMREHVTPDVRMHYIITHGGDAANVVPGEAEGLYMIRAHQPDNLRDITDRVRKIAQGAALMTGTNCEEVFLGALSNVLNNNYLADLQYANMEVIGPIDFTEEEMAQAAEINAGYPPGTTSACAMSFNMSPSLFDAPLLAKNYAPMDKGMLITGSTDVGDLSWKTPLSMITTACFSTASIAHSWGAVASANMSFGHKGMLHAAKTMALTAMDLLTDPEHLRAARAEFDQELALRPYINPLPDGIEPPRFDPGE
jgi:aminobenzoyl-glutamate utilization protein B